MPLSEDKEKELIKRILAGEVNLYAEFIEEYGKKIHAFVWSNVRDSSLAEELTHESFVKAYYSLRKFRGDSRFIVWLKKIALNAIKTFYTSKRGRERRLWSSIDETAPIPDGFKIEEAIAAKETLQQVHNIIIQMDPQYADVLRLCVLCDMKAVEVADILGIPEGTVHSRLHRGLKMLIEKLGASDER